MALLDWNDSYSVSIRAIDAQHRHLFDLLNKLHDAMMAGKSEPVLGPVLQELIRYVGTHFEAEEGILQKHRYPMLSEHRKQHKELAAEVIDFEEKYRAGTVMPGLPLMEFLRSWLTHHIFETDRRYSGYLRSFGVV
jgi:hemerythrin-like metal-binding protein